MQLLGTEFMQFVIMQIPNFAGFVILSAVLMHINGRLLQRLRAELEECRENREREQMFNLPSRRVSPVAAEEPEDG
jgi:hypothetical protein